MKLSDFASQLIVETDKLTKYVLNKEHPKGKHKAIVFEAALGFSSDNYQPLIDQIIEQALEANASVIKIDQFGRHLRVDLIVVGFENQSALVRTGWLIPPRSEIASLVTLYVKGESRHD